LDDTQGILEALFDPKKVPVQYEKELIA